MNRYYLCFAALVAFAGASLAIGRFALAAGPATVGFAPASSTLVMGAPPPVPTVDITVANVVSPPGLGGYTVALSFDGSVVSLSSLTDAGLFAGGANTVICSTPTITANSARAACATVPLFGTPSAGVAVGATPVPLMHASFSPVGPGTSPLGLTATVNGTPVVTTLKDPSGTPIAANLSAGSIVVQGTVPTLTPTATNTPHPSVGGVAEQLPVDALPAHTARRSSRAAVEIGIALVAVAIGVGIVAFWRARRRPA